MFSPSQDTQRGEAICPRPHSPWNSLHQPLGDQCSQVGGTHVLETASLGGIGWVCVLMKACVWRGDGLMGLQRVLKRSGQVPVTQQDQGHRGVSRVEGQLGSSSDPKATLGPPSALLHNHQSR